MGNWKLDTTQKENQIGFRSRRIQKVWRKSYNYPAAIFVVILFPLLPASRSLSKLIHSNAKNSKLLKTRGAALLVSLAYPHFQEKFIFLGEVKFPGGVIVLGEVIFLGKVIFLGGVIFLSSHIFRRSHIFMQSHFFRRRG